MGEAPQFVSVIIKVKLSAIYFVIIVSITQDNNTNEITKQRDDLSATPSFPKK